MPSQCLLCGRIKWDTLDEMCERCGGLCWTWRDEDTWMMERKRRDVGYCALGVSPEPRGQE